IYRTQIPLIAMIAPKQVSDMMQSLVVDAQEGGGLPRWSLANIDTGLMVGDPAAPILAEGLAFGADSFDTEAALDALVRGATRPGVGTPGVQERPGLEQYLRMGYIPLGAHVGAPTATSLEYYTADYAIACFAARIGDTATAQTFAARASQWARLFNPATGFIQPSSAWTHISRTSMSGRASLRRGWAMRYRSAPPGSMTTLACPGRHRRRCVV